MADPNATRSVYSNYTPPSPPAKTDHQKMMEAMYASYAKSPHFVGYDPEKMALEAKKNKVYEPWEIAAARASVIFRDPPPNGWSKDPYELMMQRETIRQQRGASLPEFDPSLGLSPSEFYSKVSASGPTAASLGLSASDIPGLPPAGVVSEVWWPGITPEMKSYYENRQVTAGSEDHARALRDPFRWVAENIRWDDPRTAANQIAWLRARENPASTDPARQGTLPPHQRAWGVLYPTDPAKLANADPAYKTVVLANQILDRGSANWSLNETGLTSGKIANSIAGKLVGAGITDISQFGPVPGGGIGNKVTGQRISETGLLGNTPSGNTQYGVSLGSNGQLQFVAQTRPEKSGGIFGDLAPFVGIGLALFAPGIGSAIGTALGASGAAATVLGGAIVQGALAEASGGDFIDGAIKGAVTAGVAPAVAGTIGKSVATAMADSAMSNVVANAVTNATSQAITAAFTGGDVEDAALKGAVLGAANAAGKELGISAQYGTDAFSEQTKALLSQEAGMGGASQIGGTIGTALGKIATGADAEQVLTSTLINEATKGLVNTVKSTVSDAIKVPSTKVAESGVDTGVDTGVEVPGATELADIISGPSGVQVATTDTDAALQALQDSSDKDDVDALLGLSSAEAGKAEKDAVDQAVAEEKPSTPSGFTGPPTEDRINRMNEEFARYLDYLQAGEPPPPEYGVQDLGISDENWDSFNKNLLQMQEEGRLPTQWKPNEDGTFTYTGDDGDTITINPDGSIVDYTEAPLGNLPGETPAPAPAPAAATIA